MPFGMFRHIFRVPIYRLAGVVPLYEYRDPFDDTEKIPIKPPETPWERVISLFQYTQEGYASKEYVSTIQLTGVTFVAGVFIGALKGSVQAYDKFMLVNMATKFVSAYEARRRLQDTCMLEGLKTGLTYGAKISTFVGIMGMGIIIVSAYRGKDGILEYSLSAGLAGAIVRCYLGIYAAGVGFLVGASLGTIIGTIIWAIGKLSGVTIRDTQDMMYQLKVARDQSQSQIYQGAQEAGYQDPYLKKWLKDLRNKFKYTVDDRDVKYVSRPIVTNDTDESSTNTTNTNNVEQVQIVKDDIRSTPVIEEVSREEKADH